ncbi:MAG TPA: hypothetical protein VMY41_04840 [Thermohalobaculum sp.]|nr:hypothetical protein [Thermohalobaculum sp.]
MARQGAFLPILIAQYVAGWPACPVATADDTPWAAATDAPERIRAAVTRLGAKFDIIGKIHINHSAIIERGVCVPRLGLVDQGAG